MDTIIGLGNAGCSIADKFANYPQYNVYKIDVGLKNTKRTFGIKEQNTIEEYETKLPSMRSFFKNVNGEILFVVGGGGKVSSASLAILKNLRKTRINILYVKPTVSLLNHTQQQLERMAFGVFQNYARSGLFERMYIVSNEEIEKNIGGITIKNYYDTINDFIVSTFHMLNVYRHNKTIANTFCEPPLGARISTIGFSDFEKNEDKLFFSLDKPTDVVYYCAYHKDRLETDSSLMEQIKKIIVDRKNDNVRATYGIYETDYDQDYIYCVYHTSIIQQELED